MWHRSVLGGGKWGLDLSIFSLNGIRDFNHNTLICTLYIFSSSNIGLSSAWISWGWGLEKVFFIFPKICSSSSTIILPLRRLVLLLTKNPPGVGTTAQGTENFAREVKLEKKKTSSNDRNHTGQIHIVVWLWFVYLIHILLEWSINLRLWG